MSYLIDIISDLYKAGISEDGEDIIGNRYYVVAIHDGVSYAHNTYFNDKELIREEDFFYYITNNALERVENLCNRIKAHVEAGGVLSFAEEFWTLIDRSEASLIAFEATQLENEYWS